jgi:hypothetical protein
VKHLLHFFAASAMGAAMAACKPKPSPITPEEVKQAIRADAYTGAGATKLEKDAADAATENDRLTARVLLAESWMRAQSPIAPPEVRRRLKELIAEAPGSWQAQVARLQIMRTYNVHTETDDMIAAADEALASVDFDLLNSPRDPLLASYLEAMDYQVRDMREVFIYMRGACRATTMDLESARVDYERLPESGLKKQLGYQIRDLEAITPEQRERRRKVLIETVRRAEGQKDAPP